MFAWKNDFVIEVDGGQHNTQVPQDAVREAWLRQEGYTVIRFWNHEVLKQIETVKNVIWSTLNAPLLNPPPKRGRSESNDLNLRDKRSNDT